MIIIITFLKMYELVMFKIKRKKYSKYKQYYYNITYTIFAKQQVILNVCHYYTKYII